MFYFMENNHKVIIKCSWESGYAVSFAAGSWWSPVVGSSGKAPENIWPFYIWRANEQTRRTLAS